VVRSTPLTRLIGSITNRTQHDGTRRGFARPCVGLKPLAKRTSSPALGLGYTVATSLRLRTCRFATMEAATRLAMLGSDLAAAAGHDADGRRRLQATGSIMRMSAEIV
jgi:hypothetical protein